jgi:hypothetical protein
MPDENNPGRLEMSLLNSAAMSANDSAGKMEWPCKVVSGRSFDQIVRIAGRTNKRRSQYDSSGYQPPRRKPQEAARVDSSCEYGPQGLTIRKQSIRLALPPTPD